LPPLLITTAHSAEINLTLMKQITLCYAMDVIVKSLTLP